MMTLSLSLMRLRTRTLNDTLTICRICRTECYKSFGCWAVEWLTL